MARLQSFICHTARVSSEQFRDLPGSVTEVVTGRARTAPGASNSWPWVLESEIQDESEGGALPHRVLYSRMDRAAGARASLCILCPLVHAEHGLVPAKALARTARVI